MRHIKIPTTKIISAEFDESLLYGLRPPDSRLDFLCPWVFCQLWYPHRLRSPSPEYALTVWSEDWDPKSEKRPVAGRDFFLNDKYMRGQPHWISFPERPCFKSNLEYQALRHSWILVERSYPVVPCAENTPLPNRKQSKQQRAKLFNIYLRSWTLIATEANDSKPYIADLDEVKTATETHRDMRKAWKHFYTTGLPKPWAQQIMNFVRATSAEGQASFLDDDEDKYSKMNAVTCPLSTSDIGSLLKSAYSQLKSKNKHADTASDQTEIRNRRLDEATATAVAALWLQGTDTHSENDIAVRDKAMLHCIPMHKETKKKVVDETEKIARLASVDIYTANWKQRYERWLHKLLADPSKRPYPAQMTILQEIHSRCVLEHDILAADVTVQASKQAAAEDPLFRLIHGLPGSGKSQILKWLRTYFNEVWLWEEGIHYQFLAPLNSMADNIGYVAVYGNLFYDHNRV